MRASGAVEDLETQIAALHASSFGWAMTCCRRDREEACEVLQESYWKVLSGRAQFEGRSSLRTWLFGVIRMTALEQRRGTTRARLREAPPPPDEPPASGASPESSAADRQRAEALGAALTQLSVQQREVLHLVFYEDLTIAAAADVMGVSLGTARTHYERGKDALARLLRKEPADERR
jgi:RNA polymerase sigma-70 factor (ECF subfamily)